ncbi:MAG: lysophospholipid acyltransferase family protein [Planctomycetota bacterium]
MSRSGNWKQRTVGRLVAMVWPQLTRLQNYRVGFQAEPTDPARGHLNSPGLYIFWHEFLAVLCPKWAHSNLTLLISQHRDGEWINQVALGLGYKTARGSSTRGGTAALRQLVQSARENSIVMTPEGPRGPRREMSQGAAYLGAKLQIPVIPVGVGVRSCWRLKTWDQAPIPKPFGQVRVLFGTKLWLPETISREQLELNQIRLQAAMDEVNQAAQDWAEGRIAMEGYAPRMNRKAA